MPSNACSVTRARSRSATKSRARRKSSAIECGTSNPRFDASFAFAAAKRLSDDERLVLTVRRASASDAIIGAVTIPVDAVEDANDPFVRDKKRDASHVRAFWTRLADPPPPPPPDVGTLRVACFADADAPGRIRVFVASARSEGDFGDDGDDEGRGATTDATRVRAGTCVPRLRRAFSSSSASYVRVSLNRVEPNRVAPKWDDRRRTATVRLGPDGVTYLFDESFTYEHVALDGDSSVSFELFREDALGGDGDAVAQMSLPVKHLPRARDGDAGGGDETSDARKKKRPNVRRVRTSADLDPAPRAQAQTQAGGVHGTEPEDEDAKAAHASPRGARAGVGGGRGEPRVFGRRKKPTLSGNRRNGGGGRRRRRE